MRLMGILIVLTAAAAPAGATERRCGWYDNPTPANATLIDRRGEWTLSEQGGYEAQGIEALPDMSGRDWVVTNGSSYGYGCACVTATWDRRSRRAVRITAGRALPLRRCRADRSLPRR